MKSINNNNHTSYLFDNSSKQKKKKTKPNWSITNSSNTKIKTYNLYKFDDSVPKQEKEKKKITNRFKSYLLLI